MTNPPAWDVIGIGENSVDYVYRLPELPSRRAKLPIKGHAISPGGQVATAMCACARLGLRASYAGAFGDDENGVRIREAMERHGVHLGGAIVRRAANRYAVILVSEATGERVVMWERDPSLAIAPSELDTATLAKTRVLHVDATDEPCAIAAARAALRAGVLVTCDIDAPGHLTAELIHAVDVVMLAEGVPRELTGEADLGEALRRVRVRDRQSVCVTLGDRGAVLLAGDRLYRSPAYHVDALDTTGAGDVFRAAFIHALLRGAPPEEMLRFANAAAAVSCTRAGAIDSVPSREEIDALLDRG